MAEIRSGLQYRFIYPDFGLPTSLDLLKQASHSGEVVKILKKTIEGNDGGIESMWLMEAEDGWRGEAFESELHSLDYPWPNDRDQYGNRVWQTAHSDIVYA